jgi:hypothetical protein
LSSSVSQETNPHFVVCVITRSQFQSRNSMSGFISSSFRFYPSSRAVLIPPGASSCRRLLLIISQASKRPRMLLTIEQIPYSHPVPSFKTQQTNS